MNYIKNIYRAKWIWKNLWTRKNLKNFFDEDKDRQAVIMLGSELVFVDEIKETVNNSFLIDYIITELLVYDELTSIQK